MLAVNNEFPLTVKTEQNETELEINWTFPIIVLLDMAWFKTFHLKYIIVMQIKLAFCF